MKRFPSLLALVAITAPAATAQDTAPAKQPPLPPFSPQDAQKELDTVNNLVRTTDLWERNFDWKETGASTADVIAHARQMLGPEAPPIEVRGKDISRSSFTLQQAPLGSVLCSLAELANDKVWVFPGRIVLAPESALSAEEKEAIKNSMAGPWKQTYKWDAQPALEKVTLRVVAADMKTKLAAKGQTEPIPAPPPPTPQKQNGAITRTFHTESRYASYELPFGELDQVSQQALQSLVNQRQSRRFGMTYINNKPVPAKPSDIPKAPQIASNVRVCLDDRQPYQKSLFFREPEAEKPQLEGMEWYVSESPPAVLPR